MNFGGLWRGSIKGGLPRKPCTDPVVASDFSQKQRQMLLFANGMMQMFFRHPILTFWHEFRGCLALVHQRWSPTNAVNRTRRHIRFFPKATSNDIFCCWNDLIDLKTSQCEILNRILLSIAYVCGKFNFFSVRLEDTVILHALEYENLLLDEILKSLENCMINFQRTLDGINFTGSLFSYQKLIHVLKSQKTCLLTFFIQNFLRKFRISGYSRSIHSR